MFRVTCLVLIPLPAVPSSHLGAAKRNLSSLALQFSRRKGQSGTDSERNRLMDGEDGVSLSQLAAPSSHRLPRLLSLDFLSPCAPLAFLHFILSPFSNFFLLPFSSSSLQFTHSPFRGGDDDNADEVIVFENPAANSRWVSASNCTLFPCRRCLRTYVLHGL